MHQGMLPKVVYALTDRMEFKAFGINDTATEFIYGDGRRAARENIQWRMERDKYPATHGDVDWAVRLVDLTIAFSPSRDYVAGPIDALELFPNNGPVWKHRKSQCPE